MSDDTINVYRSGIIQRMVASLHRLISTTTLVHFSRQLSGYWHQTCQLLQKTLFGARITAAAGTRLMKAQLSLNFAPSFDRSALEAFRHNPTDGSFAPPFDRSALEAFRHNPTDGSFAPPFDRSATCGAMTDQPISDKLSLMAETFSDCSNGSLTFITG